MNRQAIQAIKVGMIGPPSSGKTTLAKALHEKLLAAGVESIFVEEYASQWIRRNRRVPTIQDQRDFYDLQVTNEDYVPGQPRVIVTDTCAHLSYLYSTFVMDPSDTDAIESFLLITRAMLRDLHRYDLLMYLPPPGPVVADEHRLDQHLTSKAQARIEASAKGLLAQYEIRHETAQSTDHGTRLEDAFELVMSRLQVTQAGAVVS